MRLRRAGGRQVPASCSSVLLHLLKRPFVLFSFRYTFLTGSGTGSDRAVDLGTKPVLSVWQQNSVGTLVGRPAAG
jgi:hypothetical protein